MSNIYVSSGVTSTGISLKYYDRMYVNSGGVANSTTVSGMPPAGAGSYEAYLYVSSGGTANSTTVFGYGYMVSVANPAEWNFLCSGDFDGNGSHDIAMINGEGVVGIWGIDDGYLNSWSILSAVDQSAWMLAGVGDFNGDGTDDIAWCNNSTNLAGYWQISDKQLTTWANIATLS